MGANKVHMSRSTSFAARYSDPRVSALRAKARCGKYNKRKLEKLD